MNLNLRYKNKSIKINCKVLKESSSQGLGLMFQPYNKAKNLLFTFEKPRKVSITTFFCFFPILVIYFKDKKILGYKIAKTFRWTIPFKKKIDSFLEVPLTSRETEKLTKIRGLSNLFKAIPRLGKVSRRGRKV
ncbi:MAG: DUF192 domain-containing protein [archaeon]|nr:MAG: DUF192 domain-containing protein [archaeon]